MSDSTLSTWKAGAAKICITPSEPMWLAGWAVRKEPSRGTVSDLYCRALTLEDPTGKRLVIVTLDLIAAESWLTSKLRMHLRYQRDIPESQVILCASHTHCGPELRANKEYFFQIPREWIEKIPRYVKQVEMAMLKAVDKSLSQLRSADLFFARTHATFGKNRRKGNDIHDEDVPVLDVIGSDSKRIATVFGYACHNLTMDPQDLRYCADWSGFAAEQLERDNPGSVALFMTGAGADQDPHPRGSLELAQQHGREIATNVQQAINNAEDWISGELRTSLVDVKLPFQPVVREKVDADARSEDVPLRRKAEWLLKRIAEGWEFDTHKEYTVQAIEIGSVLLIAMSCEPVVEWALNLRREFPDRKLWVAGYCNDMFGYIPTRRVQEEGGYEGGRATLWSWVPGPFTDDVEERVMKGIRRAVQKLQPKEKQ